MTNEVSFQKCFDKIDEVVQTSNVKSIKFSFLWTVNNFKEFMNRQYEFTSPIFCGNLSSGTSKWKMIIHPENIYPEGIYVALRLVIVSEMDRSYSLLNNISFIDKSGKEHKLKTREKVFRRTLDFDDCPIISNIDIKKKDLLTDESLVIRCEIDLLECEIMSDMTYKSFRSLHSSINRSCELQDNTHYLNEKVNIPTMTQGMNDLSYPEVCKKSSNKEKNVSAFMEKDTPLGTPSRETEKQICKAKEGLEILSNDFKHLYYNSNQHDVIIYTDDGKLPAHEIVLIARSSFFKKALLLQKDKEMSISGIDVETLDAVLYYLYTGKLKQMTENSAINLMKAAKLLELPCLENMTTETFLSSRIGINNVINVFLMAKELKIDSLKNSALKFMAENHEEVTKTEQWNEMMRNDPHSAGEVLLTIGYYQNKIVNNV